MKPSDQLLCAAAMAGHGAHTSTSEVVVAVVAPLHVAVEGEGHLGCLEKVQDMRDLFLFLSFIFEGGRHCFCAWKWESDLGSMAQVCVCGIVCVIDVPNLGKIDPR